MAQAPTSYDVIIVGAGVAGCALAHGLSTLPRSSATPLRIAVVERSLAEPDRIVGELLQPGGVMALESLGLEGCLEGIDAVTVKGYCVVEDGKSVHIPYPGSYEGRSFHHGRFIMKLREAARKARGVELIEGTVTGLIEADYTGAIVGATVSRKNAAGADVKETLFAGLVIVADGCFSNFRSSVMGAAAVKPELKSYFVGAILEDARLPIPNHGTVALVKGFGPVLLYQISEHDTRMLVDVKGRLPSDVKGHILKNIVPQLPSALHLPIQKALDHKDRLKSMPNSFLPPIEQGTARSKEGAILIGDSWNMRHPLTGGGMTVAFHDVVVLRELLGSVEDFKDWKQVKKALHRWHWDRKPLSSTVNILSVALYDLFGADGEELQVLRTGCFKYFERGGECINGPVSLLSAIAPSPALLAYHFFSVAFYSIWVMFTHPHPVSPPPSHSNSSSKSNSADDKPVYETPSVLQYPALFVKSISVFWTACIVFGPLLWSELRWWAASDTSSSRNQFFILSLVPLLLLLAAVNYGIPGLGLLGLGVL
ncbi:squalene epoxidase [Pholiota conissans]|uniref:Squalene monooxygenase n=1 Tax=Pholiota conissans TaxID=109636 RepID=A0A9P5Z9G3_9AGAR|nr:squalene epoxidase [Pholiota conissans]